MSLRKRDGNSSSGRAGRSALLSKSTVVRSVFALTLILSIVWALHLIPLAPQPMHKAHASGTTPIQHIVFIIKENHSFDNYFGRFPGVNGATTGLAKVNGVQQTITLSPIIDQPDDYCHVWKCHIKDVDNGTMDGFNLSKPCKVAPYGCYQAA